MQNQITLAAGEKMPTSQEFIEFVCEQIDSIGTIRYRKMFGEYMVYANDKPILLVCDNTVYVKMLEPIEKELSNPEKGVPYKGAKEHFILDIDDEELAIKITTILKKITPLPKPKKKKIKE